MPITPHGTARDINTILKHAANDVASRITRHVVVDAPSGQDDLGVIANFLGLMSEVVGIDPDAVAADHTGAERQEVPFATRGF
jgi:hypothetical protein